MPTLFKTGLQQPMNTNMNINMNMNVDSDSSNKTMSMESKCTNNEEEHRLDNEQEDLSCTPTESTESIEQKVETLVVQDLTIMQRAKKTAVAVSGGALIVVGIPMIPLPVPGCLVIAGGFSVLATEFPAAQKVLDRGVEKIRNFAENDRESKAARARRNNQDELGLGFEMVGDDPKKARVPPPTTSSRRGGVDALRAVTRTKILPFLDGSYSAKRREQEGEEKEQWTERGDEGLKEKKPPMNGCYEMYNVLSGR